MCLTHCSIYPALVYWCLDPDPLENPESQMPQSAMSFQTQIIIRSSVNLSAECQMLSKRKGATPRWMVIAISSVPLLEVMEIAFPTTLLSVLNLIALEDSYMLNPSSGS